MTMATIRYMAKGSYQKDIGDAHGISQQTMSRIVKKVVEALARQMPNFVKFSLEPEKLQKTKEGFYEIAQFPQCIGAIDCTHIKIKNPGIELGGRHRCRKGFYSVNVQVICDSNFKICDIVARWRGSSHDSRIWRESRIKQRLENSNLRGGVLLGDNGYPCSNILLTPFRISENLQRQQQRYNKSHILTRNVIEKLFGQLKNKFMCCLNGIMFDLQTAKNMIVAIAVLHNISRDRALSFFNDVIEEVQLNDDMQMENQEEVSNEGIASRYRQNFVDRYFT